MSKRGLGLIVVLAACAALGYWWRTRGDGDTTASTTTQPSLIAVDKPAARNPLADVALQSHLTVTVVDDKGPVANAVVRLAPEDGEVVIQRTDAQGVAHAELAPGRWAVSASAEGHEPAGLVEQLSPGEDERVKLTLPGGGRALSGLVTDVYGGPVAGVRIDAASVGAVGVSGNAIATASTGSDGRYKLSVPAGTLLVAARSADYAAQSRIVAVGPAGATADFALVPGGVIEGVVRDRKTREPVANAAVEATQESAAIALAEQNERRVIAGPDGRFRITGLRPGAYNLRAKAGERASLAPTRLALEVAEQVTDVQILVGTGPVVHGKVVDEDGKPAPEVRVFATGEQRGGEDAKSGADGTFVLVGLPPGRWAILASGENYVPVGIPSFALATSDVDVVVKVRRGHKLVGHVEPRQPCDVRLEPGEGAFGGAMLMAAPSSTSTDGSFSLGPAAPGKATISARCTSGDAGSLDVDVPASGEVIVHVAPGATIAGRVVDGDGKPVANVVVMASHTGSTEHTVIVDGMVTSGTQGVTGPDGAYELRGMSAGDYRLSVLERGKPLRMRTPPKATVVTLATNEHKTGVELAIDRATGVIKGVVTGPDGKPVADAWVSVHQDLDSMIAGMMGGRGPDDDGGGGGPEQSRMVTVEATGDGFGGSDFAPALTDANGHYELTGLPHTTFDVIAEAQGGKLRGRVAKVTPDATTDIALAGLTSIKGTVHGAKGLFTVKLEGPTQTTRSFADGTDFVIEHVDAGDYKVSVTSTDGNGEATTHVDAGQTATVDITLASNAIVTGKVVDATGKGLPDMPIVVTPDQGGHAQVSLSGPPPTSGPDGTFRLEAKPGPSIVLVLTQPRPVSKRVTLEAGKVTDAGSLTVDTK